MAKSIELRLYDTLTESVKSFLKDGNLQQQCINIYVCGITPYNHSHLGHGRSYINFDVLLRTLKFMGFQTNYVRNFTDIDDKLLKRAEQQLGSMFEYSRVAQVFIDDFHQQMHALNCLAPNVEPLATDSIPEIVDLIQILLDKGVAYKSGLDIFYDISKFSDYGKLSKKSLEDLEAGARVSVNDDKRNPMDFVLWKGNDQQQFWDTPLGFGRPGWHIECSAMVNKNCAGKLDIHGGGADLIFPHHDNEIAQSEAANEKPLATCWMHNGLLNISDEKMSKSGSNSLSMQIFFKNYSAKDFRFYILQHHYRSPIDFSPERLLEASKARSRLIGLKNLVSYQDFCSMTLENGIANVLTFSAAENAYILELLEALFDDLGTAKMIGLVFKNLDFYKQNQRVGAMVIRILEEVLGLSFEPYLKEEVSLPEDISKMMQDRAKARENKDWAMADRLRVELLKMGYEVKDEKK